MAIITDAEHPRGAIVFFYGLFAAALAAFTFTLSEYLADVLLGLLAAGMAYPLYERILAALKGRKLLAGTVTTVLVAVLVAVPLFWLVSTLAEQAAQFYALLQETLAGEDFQQALHGRGWLGRKVRRAFELFGARFTPDAIRNGLGEYVGVVATYVTAQLNVVLTSVFLTVYHFVLMLVVLFYGLVDGDTIKQRAFALSPLPDDEEELIVQKFKDVGIAIMFGSGAASVLQGTLGGLAMWVAGIPSPLFWGVIMAIFAFLPLVGTNVVIVPATIYLLMHEEWAAAILFFVFSNVQGLIIDNFLTPRLVGGRMRMHNLLIFLALLGGISTFGMGGLVYGPLLAALVLTLVDLYERVYRQRLFGSSRRSLVP